MVIGEHGNINQFKNAEKLKYCTIHNYWQCTDTMIYKYNISSEMSCSNANAAMGQCQVVRNRFVQCMQPHDLAVSDMQVLGRVIFIFHFPGTAHNYERE